MSRARGNKAVVLCKRANVSWAEDRGSSGVFVFERVFSVDSALAMMGTKEGAL
jgi:hypothetical protein